MGRHCDPVRGLAVSAVAAGVLAEEAGIPAETIAKFLHDGRRVGDPTMGLRPGEAVVVDEAAMVATGDLAALADAVEAADAKLVLVGDHRQLGAVEAGGLFRLLVTDSRAAQLHLVRRFSHPWEAKASLRLRHGDETGLDDYQAHGRISGGTRDEMIDEAFAAWHDARRAGESVVVVAPDHATVDALAMRARALRVAAGDVEPSGLPVGDQVVGRGDEIVTLRNDRRLVTTSGLWVRNGDRWSVDARRKDGALVVSHLDGHGRVVLPPSYAADHVALSYAVTVHKAEGVTVDRAVLLADAATSAEHFYVGMTRGRHDNRACVVTEAASTGHGNQPPPTPVEVLTAVIRRSSSEISATETLRTDLDRGEDRETLRRLYEQVRAHIDASAGPDRRPELRHLQRLRSRLPTMRDIVTVNEGEVARLDNAILTTRRSLSDAQVQLEHLTRRRRFRRLDRSVIVDIDDRLAAHQRHLQQLQQQRSTTGAQLARSRHRLAAAERDVSRIPDVEAAIERRSEWLLSQPDELTWEADLAAQLAGRMAEPDPPPAPNHEPTATDYDLEAVLRSIDLRSIDLSATRPRTGMERRLRRALGINRPNPVDIRLPPLPGRGIEGPDLGL